MTQVQICQETHLRTWELSPWLGLKYTRDNREEIDERIAAWLGKYSPVPVIPSVHGAAVPVEVRALMALLPPRPVPC